jgi:hypothetical protein
MPLLALLKNHGTYLRLLNSSHTSRFDLSKISGLSVPAIIVVSDALNFNFLGVWSFVELYIRPENCTEMQATSSYVLITIEIESRLMAWPTLASRVGKAKLLGKSYSRKKTGRSDGFAGWLLLSLERWQLHVCISSQKRSSNKAQMDPWPSGR